MAATPRRDSRVSPEIEIRRLSFSDLPQVIAVERRSFPAPWSLAMFVLELSKPSSVCLAATEDDRLAGYLVCSRYEDVWHVMNVAVDPPARRRGIGSELMQRMIAETADRPGEPGRYTLEVRRSNRQALEMYRAMGFREDGVRHRYYHDNGEDAVIMWLGRR
ncbi:MAG: ribosomal protein S18-alanine N-acetyltransferase [Solirubrobacterales bacterium]